MASLYLRLSQTNLYYTAFLPFVILHSTSARVCRVYFSAAAWRALSRLLPADGGGLVIHAVVPL